MVRAVQVEIIANQKFWDKDMLCARTERLYSQNVEIKVEWAWRGRQGSDPACQECIISINEVIDVGLYYVQLAVAVQLLSCVDSETSWTAARQAFLSFTVSQSLLKLMSIEWMMQSNHPILCCPLLLLPSVSPSIRVFSNGHVTDEEKEKVKEFGRWMECSEARLCFFPFSSLKKHTLCSAPPYLIWGVSGCHFAICGWCEFWLVLPSEREFTQKQIKNALSKISFIKNKDDILNSWHLLTCSNSKGKWYLS